MQMNYQKVPFAKGAFSNLNVMVYRKHFVLMQALTYHDKKLGIVEVPIGFTTDFASIHPLRFTAPLMYAVLSGYGKRAATVHDYLYTVTNHNENRISRKDADKVFFRALRDEGVARWRAYLLYYGVRAFGVRYFNAYE